MPNTFTQLYIHIVFAVKGRQNLISTEWMDELQKYICGIINGRQQKVYAIGGMPDHLHLFVSIKPDISISELVRDIKANSSRWINQRKFIKGKFQWQEGFGAFSYAQSQVDVVVKYINNQEEHHNKKSFKEEYLELLKRFNVEFDERYTFDWIQ